MKKIIFDDSAWQGNLFDDIPQQEEAPEVAETVPATADTIRFMSFGSGSSGNCAYVGDDQGGFLIDAGVDKDYVFEKLRLNNISPESIAGIVITHDHGDHVRRVYSFVRKHKHWVVFATPLTLKGILRRHSISRRLPEYHTAIFKEFPFKIGNFTVTAFDVPHDGMDNVGYFIEHVSGINMTVCTDLGAVNSRAEHYLRQANHIVLESNYDLDMLLSGPYPEHLKQRIRQGNGHLGNADTAACLRQLYSPRLSHIFLCHLSMENNTPELALKASREALLSAGAQGIGDASESLEALKCKVQLYALPRLEASPLFFLRKPN